MIFNNFLNYFCSTRGFAYDTRQIFSDVTVAASQLQNADFKAIWAMITFYGGNFQSNLNKSCTHLICGKADGDKYEEALKHENIKIVTPDWVVESIKSSTRLDEDSFHPKYLVYPKAREPTPPPAGDLSTAQILGFADDVVPPPAPIVPERPTSPNSTQALLEKLKQRMPWNRPASTAPPTPGAMTQSQMSFPQPSFPGLPTNKPSMPTPQPQPQVQPQQPQPQPQAQPQQHPQMQIPQQQQQPQQQQTQQQNQLQAQPQQHGTTHFKI